MLDQAFGGVEEPLPIVLERDRSQAELVMPLEQYLARRVTPVVAKTARTLYAKHRTVLDVVAGRYGVPPRMLVAVWGIESNFGRFSGVRPTILALATLAWDPRRSMMFRNELSAVFVLIEDHDCASIANFLKGHGWTGAEGWGREVKVSPEGAEKISAEVGRRNGSCQATRDMTVALSRADWDKLGVRTSAGGALPDTMGDASLVTGASRHFLVSSNYDALLEYNCAHAYAISVGLLADKIQK